jgi:hypothetical protein
MRKGGFVWRNHRMSDRPGSADDVRRHHNEAFRKRVRRLSDGHRIEPHDVLVSISKLSAIVVEVRSVRRLIVVRRDMGVDDGRVPDGGRLVHVFPGKHRRHGQPGGEHNDSQDSNNRPHAVRKYMSSG